jgi:hypothetical protein
MISFLNDLIRIELDVMVKNELKSRSEETLFQRVDQAIMSVALDEIDLGLR